MKSSEWNTDIDVGLSENAIDNLAGSGKINKSRKQVLVVDDNRVNRMILNRMLSDEYDVLEAENGKEVLLLFKEKKPKISAILLDIFMPEMDGYEFLKYRMEDPDLVHIPVIVLSRAESRENELKALELGANDFIRKPYDPMIIRIRLSNNIGYREAIEKQAALASLLDGLPGGVVICVVKKGEVNVSFFNSGLSRLRGYSEMQLRKKFDNDIMSFVHPDEKEDLFNFLIEESSERREIEAVYRTVRPNGEVRINRLNARCVTYTETSSFYFAQIMDITD